MGFSPADPNVQKLIADAQADGRIVRDSAATASGPQAIEVPCLPVANEEEFRAEVKKLATVLGWKTYHTRDSRGSDEGFPDDFYVRERVVQAELKTMTGRVSPKQRRWLSLLAKAGAEVYLWRPEDWNLIRRVLSHNGRPDAPLPPPSSSASRAT